MDKRFNEIAEELARIQNEMQSKGMQKAEKEMYNQLYHTRCTLENLIEDLTPETAVCSQCGSESVSVKMWVNPNTNEIKGDAQEEADKAYCDNCEDHVELKFN